MKSSDRKARSLPVISGDAPKRTVPSARANRAVADAALAASSATPAADGSTPAADGSVPVRIGFVTLGCDKNTVDSERLLGRLLGAGAELTPETTEADVVVINTFAFIEAAKEESIDAILGATRLKEEGRVRAVVATGCLVQRYKDDLASELPEVDLLLALNEADRLIPELRERGLLPEPDDFVPTMERPLRVLTSGTTHTSHLKISEGCDHTCAFCAIPLMRGKFRSMPIERLVREARELEDRGVVELNIVSQDTTWYGRDWLRGRLPTGDEDDYLLGVPFEGMAGSFSGFDAELVEPAQTATSRNAENAGGPLRSLRLTNGQTPRNGRGQVQPANRRGRLPQLLRALLDETGIPWIRLFYMYPSGIYPELLELMARESRIVPYLDMPIQHGSDTMLTRMRRPERRKVIRERVDWLRGSIPDLALRTTVIVGFPGETEREFEEMLDLIQEIGFDRLGAFGYSVEEGTRAAEMPDHVPETVRRERLERLMDVQRAISLERNESWIGREVEVLVDRHAGDDEPGDLIGRMPGQALDIDGVVRLQHAPGVRPGGFSRARITGADEDDLTGKPVAAAALMAAGAAEVE